MPEPVGDFARMSRPASASGRTRLWIGNGAWMSRLASCCASRADTPSCVEGLHLVVRLLWSFYMVEIRTSSTRQNRRSQTSRDGGRRPYPKSIGNRCARLESARYGKICRMATAVRYVYDFDEPSEGGRELLGGKGAGLAEMTALGVPVPAGFTITTDACRAYSANGGAAPGRASRSRSPSTCAALEEQDGQALRRSRGAAARLGALRRRGLDAGDDGHDPEPRAERRGGRGARALDRERRASRTTPTGA